MLKRHLILIITGLFFLNACQAENSNPATIHTHTPVVNTPQNPPSLITNTSASRTATPVLIKTTTPTTNRYVTLMAVGDIMLGRTIGDRIESEGYQEPFLYTAETLNLADITIGNLECPISDRGTPENKPYAFRAPPAAGESLAYAGFNLVNLANNHILDYGVDAMQDTIDILASNQIHTVGAGMNEAEAYAPVFIGVNGLRLAFLSFAEIPASDYDYTKWQAGPNKPGIAWAHPDRVREGVQAAKKQADIVIVLVHNGYEFFQTVTQHQQTFAHLAIDSGASLVIGSHPHVLQRVDRYRDGLIAYSMGNFVFDNFLFPPNYSAILLVELSEQGIETYELIDVVVQLDGVPQIMPYRRE